MKLHFFQKARSGFLRRSDSQLGLRRELWIFRRSELRLSSRAHKSKTRTFNDACAILAKMEIPMPLKYIGKIFAKFGAIYFFAKIRKFPVQLYTAVIVQNGLYSRGIKFALGRLYILRANCQLRLRLTFIGCIFKRQTVLIKAQSLSRLELAC